jgi:acetylornithine deacetylase/succinyl-diaminopimelate desuccinylase-like protein
MRDSKRLVSIFRSLSESRQQAMLDYAEFLAGKEGADTVAAPPAEPLPIPRPEQENVVKAIQRLMQTYPMLERNQIFHEASAQMTRHLIHGVTAADAIDELERIFARQYQQHREAQQQDPQSP